MSGFDSQTAVWPNVFAVIATTIRVCDFIKLVFSNVQVCVWRQQRNLFSDPAFFIITEMIVVALDDLTIADSQLLSNISSM